MQRFFLGAALLLLTFSGLGWAGVIPFAVASAAPSSVSGSQAADLSSCSGGYAVGGCNQVSFAWSAPQMSPQAALVAWNQRFAGVPGYVPISAAATCGFGVLYQSNLPAYSQTQAKYVPIDPTGTVSSWFTVGGTVYLLTATPYTYPCGPGSIQPTTSGGAVTWPATSQQATSASATTTTAPTTSSQAATSQSATTSQATTITLVSSSASTTTTLPPPPPTPFPPQSAPPPSPLLYALTASGIVSLSIALYLGKEEEA